MTDDYPQRLRDAAFNYMAKGYFVYPVTVALKTDGRKDVRVPVPWAEASTADAMQLHQWFGPGAPHEGTGLGLDCARSGLLVVDLDEGVTPDGRIKQGIANWTNLVKEHGPDAEPFKVRTRSGGLHLYYQQHPDTPLTNSAGKAAEDIDLRGVGGTVFAPPTHVQGHPDQAYTWLADLPPVADLPHPPAWLPALLTPKPRPQVLARPSGPPAASADVQDRVQQLCREIQDAPEGTGNTTVCRVAFFLGQYAGAGQLTETEARSAVHGALSTWARIDPGVYETADRSVADGMRSPRPWNKASSRHGFEDLLPPGGWQEPPQPSDGIATGQEDGGEQQPERHLILTPASSIRMRPVRWLWDTTPENAPPTSHGRIPMYSLAIAAGGPGLGKSQFAVWLTARITTGTLPGELHGKPRGVIYAATEDSWAYTIAPRLVAAGADLERVFRIDVHDDGQLHARLTLPSDTSLLGQAAERYSIALLVADPLLSLIDKGINDYRAAEVREALEPLVAVADRHRFTILGLAHFTKAGGSDPVSRVAGSGAFGQLIRSLIAFAQQEDENGEVEFVMSLEKNNLGRLGLPSFAYTIQPVTVETEEGPSYVSRFVLGGHSSTSVREVMRTEPDGSREETNESVKWLRGYLTDMGGSEAVAEIKKAARRNGISDSAIDRAKRKLGIKAQHSGFGKERCSHWYLPGSIPAAEDT